MTEQLRATLADQIPGLLRYARTLTPDEQLAEDLVSDTLVRAMERSDSYRADSSVQTWLHRILHNLAVDRFRSRHEVPADDVIDRVELDWRDDSYTVDASVVVARAETRDELLDALIRLPFVYRSAVVLHDAHGMTGRDVAAIQGVGLPAAKQRIRRGRMMLVSSLARGAERREVLRGVPLGCWQARSKVSDYLDEELPESDRRMLEAHLDRCPTCPPLYAALVGTRTAVGATVLRAVMSATSAADGRGGKHRATESEDRQADRDTDMGRDPNTVIEPAVLDRIRERLSAAHFEA